MNKGYYKFLQEFSKIYIRYQTTYGCSLDFAMIRINFGTMIYSFGNSNRIIGPKHVIHELSFFERDKFFNQENYKCKIQCMNNGHIFFQYDEKHMSSKKFMFKLSNVFNISVETLFISFQEAMIEGV